MVSGDISGMIRLGLIGLGAWGKNYLTTVSRIKGCRITHICAKSAATLSKYSAAYIKTSSYQDLLKQQNLDGVIIATPAATHFSMARDFIKQQIPILVEKPFTTNLHDAVILERLARNHQTLVMAGHEYLYNPAYLKLKETLPQLGRINFISAEAGNWGPFRPDTSVLWDYGPHDVAMLIDLLNGMPVSVATWDSGSDSVNARLNFSHTAAFISVSRKLTHKVRRLIVVGEKKSLNYDELAKQKLTLYASRTKFLNYAKVTPLEQEVAAFVASIKTRRQSKTDVKHAVNVMRILDALERSLKQQAKLIFLC